MKHNFSRVAQVVSVEEAVAPEQSGAIAPVEEVSRNDDATWAFIKNMNPKEVITFEDGDTFQFPSSFFITSNRELAEKLRSVSGKYYIIENSN